jgi:hypothetical protein
MDQLAIGQQQAVSTAGIDAKAFSDLQGQVKALIEQNAKLQAEAKPTNRRL